MSTSVVSTAALLVVFPVIAAIIGGIVAVLRSPSIGVVSGIQHLAAGVVVAAVAGEVLPDMRELGSVGLVVAGFSTGVLLLVLLQRLQGGEEPAPGALPVGYLMTISVDLFIDGLLVGVGAAVSTDTAVVLTIALTLEVLFLGLAVALQLRRSGITRIAAAAITAGLSLLVALGAVLGALFLADASDRVLVPVLAFAAAALLWLVVEELLVEAHETPERSWMAVLFFVGFLALYALEGLR